MTVNRIEEPRLKRRRFAVRRPQGHRAFATSFAIALAFLAGACNGADDAGTEDRSEASAVDVAEDAPPADGYCGTGERGRVFDRVDRFWNDIVRGRVR